MESFLKGRTGAAFVVALILVSTTISVSQEDPKSIPALSQEQKELNLKKFIDTGSCVRCDLSELDLREAIIIVNKKGLSINLSQADLSGANLSGAILENANLSQALLLITDLTNADLNGADLSGADLTKTELAGANLIRANLSGMKSYGINLRGVALTLEQKEFIVERVRVSKKQLQEIRLSQFMETGFGGGHDLSNMDLRSAIESLNKRQVHINLSHANLEGANLSSADLSNANLMYSDLSNANLTNANLTNANLIGAHLRGAILKGANITGVGVVGKVASYWLRFKVWLQK